MNDSFSFFSCRERFREGSSLILNPTRSAPYSPRTMRRIGVCDVLLGGTSPTYWCESQVAAMWRSARRLKSDINNQKIDGGPAERVFRSIWIEYADAANDGGALSRDSERKIPCLLSLTR